MVIKWWPDLKGTKSPQFTITAPPFKIFLADALNNSTFGGATLRQVAFY